MAKQWIWGVLGTLVVGLAFGGWGARDYVNQFATKNEIQVASAKVDYLLDQQIEAVVAQIAHLERKSNRTRGEQQHLDYLRSRLQTLRNVQKGK